MLLQLRLHHYTAAVTVAAVIAIAFDAQMDVANVDFVMSAWCWSCRYC